MFVPSLALYDVGGVLDLHAMIEVPNGCYLSDGYEFGWPNGMAGLPETIPIQLKVRHSGSQLCSMGVVGLRYVVPLGNTAGHNRVSVFTIYDGAVAASSSIELVQVASESLNLLTSASADAIRGSGTDQRYSLGTVKGWINHMPPNPPSLHIIAQVYANSSGWRFALEPAVPQGSNPAYLILDIKATPPSGNVLWVITNDNKGRYDVPNYDKNYTHVTVRNGDVSITTRIEHVY